MRSSRLQRHALVRWNTWLSRGCFKIFFQSNGKLRVSTVLRCERACAHVNKSAARHESERVHGTSKTRPLCGFIRPVVRGPLCAQGGFIRPIVRVFEGTGPLIPWPEDLPTLLQSQVYLSRENVRLRRAVVLETEESPKTLLRLTFVSSSHSVLVQRSAAHMSRDYLLKRPTEPLNKRREGELPSFSERAFAWLVSGASSFVSSDAESSWRAVLQSICGIRWFSTDSAAASVYSAVACESLIASIR
ncbi:hypothetical protein P4O66_017629 [Electrophorus voltai]|uniref:Uncharacterized protein n=1 Tax=Electrophorus voltai TaxID=2609070 RepID=A0AAD8YV92_9TELE|nr:hypothetical protein P4O66_017629 [Electrophorus voltai]